MMRATTRRRQSVLIGIAVMVIFGLAVWVAMAARGGVPWRTTTVVEAEFADVGALRSGDDVRISGVRVGQVGDITLEHGRAVAELVFDGERRIYRNSRAVAASVGARSALGQKYVAFRPGTPDAGEVQPGEIIPATTTAGAQELSDVLAQFDAPTRKALGSTLREVGGGALGHSQDMRDALAALPKELPDLATVARALSHDNGADLTRMMSAVDSLSSRFRDRHEQLGRMVGQLGTTFDAVAVDGGEPLAASIDKAPGTLRKVRESLRALDDPLGDTQRAMRALRPGAAALGQATPDVRAVLRDAVPVLDKVGPVARQAEPAVEDLTRTFADARPLAPKIGKALDSAQGLADTLAPYAPEISSWFTHAAAALSEGEAPGRWLRVHLIVRTDSATGAGPRGVQDPLMARNPYPAPGEAKYDKQTPIVGPR